MPGAFDPLPTPRPRRAPDPRFEWWKGDEPSELVKLFLRERVVPHRSDEERDRAQGHWFVPEVESAQYMAGQWLPVISKYLWDLAEVERWVVNFPEVSAELAAWWTLVARLQPEHLRLTLWYGRAHAYRPTLARQIETHRTTREDAAAWVRTYVAAEASA